MPSPLLQVDRLSVHFHTRSGIVKAVEEVSFSLEAGETLGIVGESGSGKSVSCSSLLGLLPMPPAKIASGTALFGSHDLLTLPDRLLRTLRGNEISYIFQDPMTSLNPFLSIGSQIMEPLIIHRGKSKKEARSLAIDAMEEVGIPLAEERMRAYPHEFSGGMRQRVMIAMALITRPKILIADEPTTALDVTVQKQVLDLIKEQQNKLGTAVILITHDLGIVSENADRIQVMYAGRTVESAPSRELLAHPRHAYTRALIKSIPGTTPKDIPLFSIPGLPPDPSRPICGCAFRPRNTLGNADLCLTDRAPELVELSPGHFVQNCPGCLA